MPRPFWLTDASRAGAVAADPDRGPAGALQHLVAGNRRFAAGGPLRAGSVDPAARARLVDGQTPWAAVVGCSDSRVPVEIVLDQGPGELFVVRVAGNVVAESQLGSLEFAVQTLGVRLVMILGHSGCGAVRAALDHQRTPLPQISRNLGDVLARIAPAARQALAVADAADEEAVSALAVAANVRLAAQALRAGSSVLAGAEAEGILAITGGVYSLQTGLVELLADA